MNHGDSVDVVFVIKNDSSFHTICFYFRTMSEFQLFPHRFDDAASSVVMVTTDTFGILSSSESTPCFPYHHSNDYYYFECCTHWGTCC